MTYDFDYYSGRDLTYPKAPKKPRLQDGHTALEAMDYAEELIDYEVKMNVYRTLADEHRHQTNDRMGKFKNQLRDDYDLTQTQFDLLWAKAWDDGHSAGLNQVFCYFEEIYDLATQFASLEG